MIARELAAASFDEQQIAPIIDLADVLARRYRNGETAALEPLLASVAPLVAMSLAHARNHARFSGLPPSIGHDDLKQHASLTVAELALRWDPDLGAFAAYVRVSLPLELMRVSRRFSASRGSATVTVLSIDHDTADALANRRPGEDGRRWTDSLALAEALAALSPQQRALVALVDCFDSPVAVAARRLGLTRDIAVREHRRALEQLRSALTQNRPAPVMVAEDAELLLCLLDALLDGMHPNGRLPSQRAVCRHAGLSERTYDRLMAELAASGVVTGRHTRQSGRLDFAAASALLQQLGA